jgi:hypothetical protein
MAEPEHEDWESWPLSLKGRGTYTATRRARATEEEERPNPRPHAWPAFELAGGKPRFEVVRACGMPAWIA